MPRRFVCLVILSGFLFLEPLAGDTEDGLKVYKDANYKAAIPLLKTAIAADAKNPLLHAALLSSLTYEGMLDEAADEADADASAFPQSPEVLTARGEFAYFMADMTKARALFSAAVKLKDSSARAVFGLARVFRAASYYRTARLFFLKAHELDSDDALITQYWLEYMPADKRRESLNEFAASHPWLFRNRDVSAETVAEVDKALNKRKAFEPDGARSEVNLRLINLRDSPIQYRGVGLEMTINGGHKLSLLVDTGASGILLTEKTIERAGLDKLGSVEIYGVGDAGAKKVFISVADSCEVGPLKFKTCIFRAVQGRRIGREADFDGLIGADVFHDYLLYFDFQRHLLNLTPLPERPENVQGYDREVPPDEKDFSPMMRWGGHLYVNTKMNGQASGLFLLDTGATSSTVDSTFARLSTKVYLDDSVRVNGISGRVNKVFEADKAELEFAGFRQNNIGMMVFDLSSSAPEHMDFRMSGVLGLPLLALFHLSIDYRNGLVRFERAIQ